MGKQSSTLINIASFGGSKARNWLLYNMSIMVLFLCSSLYVFFFNAVNVLYINVFLAVISGTKAKNLVQYFSEV